MATVDEQMDGLTDLEKAGMVVEIVSGKDTATAGAIPEEGQEGTVPQAGAGDELVIPVEGVTPPPAEELPTIATGEGEQPSIRERAQQPPITAGVSTRTTQEAPQIQAPLVDISPIFEKPTNIVGSAYRTTIDTLTGQAGELDPLKVPDPFDPQNGPVLWGMFFENRDDPEANARTERAVLDAVGFVVERDVQAGDQSVPMEYVVPFVEVDEQTGNVMSLDNTYDRVAYMVAMGGTRLAFPQTDGMGNQVNDPRTGNPMFDATTKVPILQELELYRRPSETDIQLGDVTLVDIPRRDLGPEGQAQFDNFLIKEGFGPYERTVLNRAEFSGYLPEVIEQGRAGEWAAIPQNIVAATVNQGISGVWTAVSEFANYPDGYEKEAGIKLAEGVTGEQAEPQIPWAPSFAEELGERIGMPKDAAEAFITFSGDYLTRTQRTAKETLPILLSFYGGRALRDKKLQDNFIKWAMNDYKIVDEKDLYAAIIKRGDTIDGVVGRFVRTQISKPFYKTRGMAERGAVRALARAGDPRLKFLSLDSKALLKYNQNEIDRLTNSISAIDKRLSARGLDRPQERLTTRDLEKSALEAERLKLVKRREKLLQSGFKSLVPETIKDLATGEGLAIAGGAMAGQIYQDAFLNSSKFMSGNTEWVEAFGAVSSTVFFPALAVGGYQGAKALASKLGDVYYDITRQGVRDFNLNTKTGDARLDARLDDLYRGLKNADPELQRYILDQFDHLRTLRDDLLAATDAEGNPLLSEQDVRLTFSQLTGLMIFDSYANYITRSLDTSEIPKFTEQLQSLEAVLLESMRTNTKLADVAKKITRAGIIDPQLAPIARTLQGLVDDTRRSLQDNLSVVHSSIQEQANMAKAYLSGNTVVKVDDETGDVTSLNFEEIFEQEDRAVTQMAIEAGESLDVLRTRLDELADARMQAWREGLNLSSNLLTAKPGASSNRFVNGFWMRRNDLYQQTGKLFNDLRTEYPTATADARFLIDELNQKNPELLSLLGAEVEDLSKGARQMYGATLPGRTNQGISRTLDDAAIRFEQSLLKDGLTQKDLQNLKDAAGTAKSAFGQFLKIDNFLRTKALDDDADQFAQELFNDPMATSEDLIHFANGMELPINFAEAHMVASSLVKLSARYEGETASIPLTLARKRFLEELAGERYGFRINGEPAGKEIMDRYAEARTNFRINYADRFSVQGTWPTKFAQGVGGNAEGLPLHRYKSSNSPEKELMKLLTTVDGITSRRLTQATDGPALRRLETEFARIFGEFDPKSGTYVLDLNSQGAKDLGGIFQSLAAEELLKSKYGQEVIEKLDTQGFDVVREILKLTSKEDLKDMGDINHVLLQNLTQITGVRRGADGSFDLTNRQPLVSDIDVYAPISIERIAGQSEEIRAVAKAAEREVAKKAKRLADKESTEYNILENKLRSFESLVKMLDESTNPGRDLYNKIKFQPEKFEELRERYAERAVLEGSSETFEQAYQQFNEAAKLAIGQEIVDKFVKYEGFSVFGTQQKRIQNSDELIRFLGADNEVVAARMRDIFGDEHYQSLINVAEFYSKRLPKDAGVKFLEPTDLTPEALYSRLNNINRGVAGIRWTVAEFSMRSMRSHNAEVLRQMFENPAVAEAFEMMLIRNEEITPSIWSRFEDELTSAVAQAMMIRAGIFSGVPGVENAAEYLYGGDISMYGAPAPDTAYRQQLESMGLIRQSQQGQILRGTPEEIPFSP